MLGAILAFASAAFFGLNNATVRRGVLKTTVLQGMAITVPLGIPIFAIFAWVMGGYTAMATWSYTTYFWMVSAGVVHFVIGRYGNYRATQSLGATLSTPVQQLSILISLALALIFLNETVNYLNLFGIALVLFGPVVVVRRKGKTGQSKSKSDFVPDYGAGFIWGFVCAIGYGASPLMITLGLGQGGTMADGAAGVLVSYIAASLVVVVLVLANGGKAYMRGVDAGSSKWYVISAIFVALSQMFRYLALTVAPVSVVVPVQRLSVVFRLIFNALINRDFEVFDRWVIGSILVSILGVIALSMDSTLLLTSLGFYAKWVKLLATPLF
ncbi:MAG: DMT family transporter [Rhodobacter sp.]|jgi:uncharacterized membrane protein|nr:MAG: hypothetical protein ABR89_12925 [Rhodobacter sp. BACL10 MAG-120910-bin24]MDO7654186.1 DMT family transporter [Paracoccaceae bacterium]MDO7733205.1 DMT family transporter [Paracoccaceae bacterium]|tara:strand:- start:11388 stop:12365 length:978 start_codon:yes stop_codon:yes gene_type:complete